MSVGPCGKAWVDGTMHDSSIFKDRPLGVLMNSWVDLDDFPTQWFTVAQMANFVSSILPSLLSLVSLQTMPFLIWGVSYVLF